MNRYPDMRDMARLATEDYSRIDSIEAINSRDLKYPAYGTPNWWALRARYETLLAARLRNERRDPRGRESKFSPEDERHYVAAKWCALGNEQATADYERKGKTRDWWLRTWNPVALMKPTTERDDP